VFVAKGASNTAELNQRLCSLMIRRTKDQVLKELPAKIRQITPVEMTVAEQRQYRAVAKTEYPNALAQITALRQEVGRIKVRAAIEWIEQYTETDTSLLVFAHHHDVLDALEAGCKKLGVTYGRIDGAVSQEQRTRLVDEFQAGKRNIMLLSTKAAGVGITLTRASNVLVVERMWEPSTECQSEDRCHRIGQDQSVTIRYLTVDDTIDVDMAELIESKRVVLAAVLDGTAPADIDLDIRKELAERLAKKE
jgi:SWI/SNF-related matrix-associated actin-dependent regulator 1 of chromatin subfamily A